MIQTVKIFLIYYVFLLIANVLWNTFSLFLVLKFFVKFPQIIFKKLFFKFVIYTSLLSFALFSLFSYSIDSISIIANFWQQSASQGTKFFIVLAMGIPLTILNYYLSRRVFNLDKRKSLTIGILMGLLIAPWPALF